MPHVGQHRDESAITTVEAPEVFSPVTQPIDQERARDRQRPVKKRSPSNLRVVVSPSGTFVGPNPTLEQQLERGRQLALTVRQRIETRLLGRVRDLAIHVEGDTVLLEGSCATFYTKQLAQHAALAVLNDERLVNNIAVALP